MEILTKIRELAPIRKSLIITLFFTSLIFSVLIYGVRTGEIRELQPDEVFSIIAKEEGIGGHYLGKGIFAYDYPIYLYNNSNSYTVVVLKSNSTVIYNVNKIRFFRPFFKKINEITERQFAPEISGERVSA